MKPWVCGHSGGPGGDAQAGLRGDCARLGGGGGLRETVPDNRQEAPAGWAEGLLGGVTRLEAIHFAPCMWQRLPTAICIPNITAGSPDPMYPDPVFCITIQVQFIDR
jgi:hypothetical protein